MAGDTGGRLYQSLARETAPVTAASEGRARGGEAEAG
jgi:hypothetical protein